MNAASSSASSRSRNTTRASQISLATTPTFNATSRREMRSRIVLPLDFVAQRPHRPSLGGNFRACETETGHPPPVIDTLLAATAIEADLYLVSRNTKDLQHCGAAVFDPWRDESPRFR